MISDFFEISQRIFPAGQEINFSVEARYPQKQISNFANSGKLRMCIFADRGMFPDGKIMHRREFKECRIALNGEVLNVSYDALEEGEYHFRLEVVKTADDGKENISTITEFDTYVLEKDLFKLRPYKGDMHVHSSFSFCGSSTDDPQYVCATARKKGLDYIALTDHIQIEGAESVLDFGQKFSSNFQVFRGEECHVLQEKLESRFCRNIFFRPVHIVNFGGRDGVCRYANEHYEEFHAQVSEMAEKISLPYDFECRYLMAASDWICDKIHEFGGLAIFCHPFWRSDNMCNMPYAIGEYILQHGKFDMLELVGLGEKESSPKQYSFCESNNLALAWWQQASIKQGKMIPVVGNTDTHDAANVLGTKYTIVFAADNDYDAIYDAFKNSMSVAVMDSWNKNIAPQIFGDYRLVKYAHFLLRNFYLEHDELCRAEGKMMQAALRNRVDSADVAAVEYGKIITKYTEHFFGN